MPQGPSYGRPAHCSRKLHGHGCKRIGCEKIGCERVGDERIGCERIGVDVGFGIRDVVGTYDPTHPAVGMLCPQRLLCWGPARPSGHL